MTEKICFIVMGFGIKMDYENSRSVNLDEVYQKVIKKAFEDETIEYQLIRADEIAGSALIDKSMYTLLMNADLVIADITTLNANALYELGIRHALKPYSTIIMANEYCKLPFDLNHSRCLVYKEINEYLSDKDIEETIIRLKQFIHACESQEIDSPFYTFLPEIIPPTFGDDYNKIIDDMQEKTNTIAKLVSEAEECKNQGEFSEASYIWTSLKDLLPSNEYVVQQLAFCTYKSEKPNKTLAYENALEIIKTLNPKKSLDLETLGITGAIYKRLFLLNNNFDYLDQAIYYYKKGYVIKNDYYNGENYANCLLLKTKKSALSTDEINYLKFESKKVYKEIIEIILDELRRKDDFWMYATLSTCYFCINDEENFQVYRTKFLENCSAEWQKQTYFDTITSISSLI